MYLFRRESCAPRCRRTWTYVNGYPVRLVRGWYRKAGYWADKNRVHRSLERNIRLTAPRRRAGSSRFPRDARADATRCSAVLGLALVRGLIAADVSPRYIIPSRAAQRHILHQLKLGSNKLFVYLIRAYIYVYEGRGVTL